MPPKGGPSKKNVAKKKEQSIEDKTFGLKNKNKSKAVQKYIHSIETSVKGSQSSHEKREQERKKKEAELQKARDEELRQIFKNTIVQAKVPFGVDPKTIVCEFFKQNQCQKGNKCKFSHDLEAGRKTTKASLYQDKRDGEDEDKKKEDTIDQWDTDKLNDVISSKHKNENMNMRTDIVCKHFLDAVEKSLYGWFWECPGGNKTCKYRHALPPGFVLKSKKGEESEDEEDVVTLEETIEEDRKTLKTSTPVTLDTFLAWKEKKRLEKIAEEGEKKAAESAEKKSGKKGLSGKDLFEYNPEMFVDDDEAMDETEMVIERGENEKIISATGTSLNLTALKAEVDEAALAAGATSKEAAALFQEEDLPDFDDED